MRKFLSAILIAAMLLSCLSVGLAEDESWTCAECGRENKASYQFCPGCGASRSQTCAACGYELQEDELDFAFCPQCGSSQTPPVHEEDHVQVTNNEHPFLITKDEASAYFIRDLPWDSDVITAVATLESATGTQAYADGSNPGVTLHPVAEAGLFPGLTDDCYMPLMNIYPTRSGGWWLEAQIGPEDMTFDTALEAAEWFSGVWDKLKAALELPSPSGILVSYPDDFAGMRTVHDTDSPDELLTNWAAAIDGGASGITVEISYNNLIISLGHTVDKEGAGSILSRIVLQPMENLE